MSDVTPMGPGPGYLHLPGVQEARAGALVPTEWLRAAGWVPASEVRPLVEAVRTIMGPDSHRRADETFHGQGGKVQVFMGSMLRRAEATLGGEGQP